jgi:hypothetical protein
MSPTETASMEAFCMAEAAVARRPMLTVPAEPESKTY